ncbi:hypothetical protein PR048_029790, partial [Dryococelus australis]
MQAHMGWDSVSRNDHWRLLLGLCRTQSEGLALVYGVNKFQKYLLGQTCTICSDHKPLLGVFDQGKPMSSVLSPRMIRPGEQLGNVDASSRLPLPDMMEDPPHPADVLFLESEDALYNAIEIAAATEADSSLRTFKLRFNELSLSCGCIIWTNQVVIPQHLQQPILEELHAHHPGIVAMKELARCYFWWLGLGEDIERVVSECQLRQQIRHSRPADLQGRNFLIVLDAYTKWLEIIPTSEVVVSILRNIFATHGLPECVVSGNGTSFTSEEFTLFLKRNGIQHLQTPPCHLTSNGMVERGVQRDFSLVLPCDSLMFIALPTII